MEKKFSYFSRGHRDVVPQVTSEEQLVQKIAQDPTVKEYTHMHRLMRAEGNTQSAKYYKSRQPCFAVAVNFEGGKQEGHIVGYTHVSLCDIDHLPPGEARRLLEMVRQDPHVRLAYITISESGLRIIFSFEFADGTDLTDLHRTDSKRAKALYIHAFLSGNEYFRRQLQLEEVDLKCKDHTRLSGLAHCPEVYYNPDALPLEVPEMQAEAAKRKPRPTHSCALEKALPVINDILQQRGVAYMEGSRNQYICQAGYLLNLYGVDQADAVEWAEKTFADYQDSPDAADILRSCYRKTEEHGTQRLPKSKSKYASVQEIEQFLRQEAHFRYNVITHKCEISRKKDGHFTDLKDRDINTLWSRMSKTVKQTTQAAIYAVLYSEFTPEFNPFTTYFASLPPWDGHTDHIAVLARSIHLADSSQQALFEECFRRWFVAIIPTLLVEEITNHTILILIGKQGMYKTTWLRRLLPPELQKYFYTKTNSHRFSKDDLLTLSEFALMCFEEIETMTQSELNQLKALVTLDYINERAAYARTKEQYPHIASFCGTGNNIQFLNDPSGTRRWLPFEVESIDNPYTHPVDYEGVYSQAYALWQNGFIYWFEQEEIKKIGAHNRYFEVPNMEEELISTYFSKPTADTDSTFMPVSIIMERISQSIKTPLTPIRIGQAMKRLGFPSKKFNNQRGYLVIEHTMEQIRQTLKNLGHYLQDTPEEERPSTE